MRTTLAITFVVFLAAGTVGQPQPNIIVFIADDASRRDSGAYGNEGIRTPGIDELARQGMRFENAYLTIAQCSPSRISILTGLYPHQTGAEDLHMPLPPGKRIVPSYLKEAGYFTGHMLKTHYGPHAEAQFDWYGDTPDQADDFIDAAGDRPFFLWMAFFDPHRGYRSGAVDPPHTPTDVTVPPQLVDDAETREDLALYYDEIARMDGHIRAVVQEIEQRGLQDRTLMLYMSDNGAPFPREKGTVYDAGIQMPLIVRWPGVVPEGSTHDGLVSAVDLAPTFLEMAGIDPPVEMPGRSLLPMLENPSSEGRPYVFSERNWHDCDEHIRSVRTERYKLIVNAYTELPLCTAADIGGSPSFRSLRDKKARRLLTPEQTRLFEVPRARIELYDVVEDPGEFTNLAGLPGFDGTIRELVTVLQNWMEETDDFPPTKRRRDDHTDRITGIRFMNSIPEMQDK